MIDTRLLGSGALSAMALMLAAAASPASAAPQITPDMMIAPDSGPAPISAPISAPASAPGPVAAMQERGRGGGGGGRGEARGGGGRSWGGGAVRSGDTGSWNGARSRAEASRGGGYEQRGGGYDRGGRSYSGNNGDYAGNSGNYAATGDARGERGARSAALRERAAIDRGDIQAPASYGEGNRGNAASPYVRTDNLAAQGVNVGGGAAINETANQSDRRGGGGRGDWNGNRGIGRGDAGVGGGRGVNVRNDNWRGDGRIGGGRGGNWADGRGDWRRDRRGDWRGNDGWRRDRRGDWRGNDGWRGNNNWRGGRQFGYNQGFRDGLRWDRGWRDNRRFNWFGHRQANRFLFTPGPYFSPFAGHFYRPVGVGFFLDPLFFQPRFFLNDPWAFRLPPSGDRFRWVRYYDDVLLVDIFTGEVVDVIENFFW